MKLPAEDQQQHREHEVVQVAEVPGEATVAGHVGDRVQVDQRRDPGDDQDHEHRQRVDQDLELGVDTGRDVVVPQRGGQLAVVGAEALRAWRTRSPRTRTTARSPACRSSPRRARATPATQARSRSSRRAGTAIRASRQWWRSSGEPVPANDDPLTTCKTRQSRRNRRTVTCYACHARIRRHGRRWRRDVSSYARRRRGGTSDRTRDNGRALRVRAMGTTVARGNRKQNPHPCSSLSSSTSIGRRSR